MIFDNLIKGGESQCLLLFIADYQLKFKQTKNAERCCKHQFSDFVNYHLDYISATEKLQ